MRGPIYIYTCCRAATTTDDDTTHAPLPRPTTDSIVGVVSPCMHNNNAAQSSNVVLQMEARSGSILLEDFFVL